jgi:SHS2 domain-containing protein
MRTAGYEEVEHTADVELRVWAPTLNELFKQAALGMQSLAGIQLAKDSLVKRELVLEAIDKESLLIEFLSELLYINEEECLGFDSFDLEIGETDMRVKLQGGKIIDQKKEIKAVTYHGIEIVQSAMGLEVSIVFDV